MNSLETYNCHTGNLIRKAIVNNFILKFTLKSMCEQDKKKEKPKSKGVELTEAQNAECRELNCCKRYNIQRVKGRSHEYAETFCSLRREKMREKTDCCKDRHLVIPALRQKLNLDPSDAGMKSVTKE